MITMMVAQITIQATILSILLYILGRTTMPKHRIYLFAIGLSLFALGALFVLSTLFLPRGLVGLLRRRGDNS